MKAYQVYREVAAVLMLPVLLATLLIYFFSVETSEIDNFLRSHKGILISLGTVLVVGLFAVLTTILSNQAARSREEYSRWIEASLKIAEFRQSWINDLRNDLAELMAEQVVLPTKSNEQNGLRLLKLSNRVFLRLNPEDELYHPLQDALTAVLNETIAYNQGKESGPKKKPAAVDAFLVSQRVLKLEWERLKADLEEAQVKQENMK